MLYIQPFYKAAVFCGILGSLFFMGGLLGPSSLQENKSVRILEEMFGKWAVRLFFLGIGLVFFLGAWMLSSPSYFFE
jgi:hypothetical protein